MIMTLVKKDIMIIKGYALAEIAIAVGIPLIIANRQPQMGGMTGLLMATLIVSLTFNRAVSGKENQYPKATALLSSTPYMRNRVVAAKYILYIIIYLFCCIVSFAEMKFIPELRVESFAQSAAFVFLSQAIGMGIFLPIQYKLGYEKTRYLCFLFYLYPFAVDVMKQMRLFESFGYLRHSNTGTSAMILFAAGLAVWIISFEISKKIFDGKDLV